jgi:uncharacterized protein YoaH (UPF0181 family)
MADLQTQMKHAVADAAVEQIKDGMVLGLGSGSTAALMIRALGAKLASGELKNIVGVTTSFQGEVLAAELNIPLLSLNAVDRIDLAIDGADEVDPSFQLIKGGGACHVQEKLVAAMADRFVVVVDSTKLVDRLNLDFLIASGGAAWGLAPDPKDPWHPWEVVLNCAWPSEGWPSGDRSGQSCARCEAQRWNRRSSFLEKSNQQHSRRFGKRFIRESDR